MSSNNSAKPTKPARAWRAFMQNSIITKTGEKLVCLEIISGHKISDSECGGCVDVVEESALQAAEERIRELEKKIKTAYSEGQDFHGKHCNSHQKVGRLEKALEKCKEQRNR